MNYNYDELIEAAERRLQGSASDTDTNLEALLQDFVNEAKDILESDLRSQFGEHKVTLTTVADQEDYDLPEEYRFGGMNRVVVDGTEYQALSPEEFDKAEDTTAYKVDARGTTITLNSAPTADGDDIDIYFQVDSPDLISGTAQAGATSSITLQASESTVEDIYNGTLIEITAGTGEGQVALITDYDGTTKVATATFTTAPDSTSTYSTIPPFPKRARRAIIEKAIELYRKKQKAFEEAQLSEVDYEREKMRGIKNNIRSQERPRKSEINING